MSHQFDDILLVKKIATGGMAELWEARQQGIQSFEKRLAVKLLLPHLAEDKEFVSLFFDEARLASQLNHTNICQIYKLGECEGAYYIAMEYIDGENITSLLRRAAERREFMPLVYACQIVWGVCAALEYAHTLRAEGKPLQIVHRDVSPPNVMITQDGHIKVIDFGIAKAVSHTHHTPTDIMRGKFAYMSPEYVFEEELDARSDIFSLGIVFWELVTGRRLFQAKSEYAKMERITQGNYPRPSQHRADLPQQLEDIIMRALSYTRKDRYASCALLQEELERFMVEHHLVTSPKRLAGYVDWLMSPEGLSQPRPEVSLPLLPPSTLGAQSPTREAEQKAPPKIASSENAPALPALGSFEFSLHPALGGSTQRVLIADDHREMRDTLGLMLSAQGYEVALAKDGLEAVSLVRENPFDLCLLDLEMPHLNGKGALQEIKKLRPSLPCIIQTAEQSFDTAAEMGRIGAVSYLVKPVRSRELVNSIEKALSHRPQGDELSRLVFERYPTPLARFYQQYQRSSGKPSTIKARHGILASMFELYAAYIGALSCAFYLHDRHSPEVLPLPFSRGHRLTPRHWLELHQRIAHSYRAHQAPFFSRHLRDLLHPPCWGGPAVETCCQALIERLSGLCLESPNTDDTTRGALSLLLTYQEELWRNDAMLSNREVAQNVGVLQPFLTLLLQQLRHSTHFSLCTADSAEATDDGTLHDLCVLQGLPPQSQTFLHLESLPLQTLYLFDASKRPLFSLFPFLSYGQCQVASCGKEGLGYLLQIRPDFSPRYQRTQCGHMHLLKGPQLALAQACFQAILQGSP